MNRGTVTKGAEVSDQAPDGGSRGGGGLHQKEHRGKQNLAPPWKPGQSGNPSGRAKGSLSLTAILRKKLAEGDGARAKRLVGAMLDQAEDGEFQHLKEAFERIDGKVSDRTQVTLRVGEAQEGLLDVVQAVCLRLNAEHVFLAILEQLGNDSEAPQG